MKYVIKEASAFFVIMIIIIMIINLNLNSKGPKLMKYVIKGGSDLIFNSVIIHRPDHQHLDHQYHF